MKRIIFFLFLFSFSVNGFSQTKRSALFTNFQNPPVTARPKALWPWVNGNFNLSQLTYEMEQAKQKGMGGFDIWDCGILVNANNQVPAGPPFLSHESLNAIKHVIQEAERLNLEIGLISSSSWNAGGTWVQPQHSAMGLFRTDTIVEGPVLFKSKIKFPLITPFYNAHGKTMLQKNENGLPPFYKDVALLAYPLHNDSVYTLAQTKVLTPSLNRENEMFAEWQVPVGKWRITRYVCAPTGQPLMVPSPNSFGYMLDHFSTSAQQSNMNYIFQRLKSVLGSLQNRALKYIYEDSYEVNSAVWTPLLDSAFEKIAGYKLFPFLPALNGFTVENKEITERFLFDFNKVLSELIINNHYALGTTLSKKEGIGFYAEAGGPGKPIHNVPFEDLKALGSLTVPRGEFWNKTSNLEQLQIVKGIASAAHIYNQRIAEAEAFTSVWLWQEGPHELKPLADRAMCEGLNRFVYHTFPHTPPESGNPGWIYNFGTLINTTNGWWSKSNAFHHYIARCSYLLQQGNFVGDVAFYYGDEAPNFVAPKHIPEGLGTGYDYDVVNTDVLLNRMTVKNGRIYLPHGQYYEVLVLPNDKRMNPQVLKKIQQMVQHGATIIGPKPQRSYSLHQHQSNDAVITNISNLLWKNYPSSAKEYKTGIGKIVWGKSIREVLIEKGVTPDFEFAGNSSSDSLDFIHRRTADADIYFIRNKRNIAIHGIATFRIKNKAPEWWDAETGTSLTIENYNQTASGTQLPLSLPPHGTVFLIFSKKTPVVKKQKLNAAPFVYTPNGFVIKNNEAAVAISLPWKLIPEAKAGTPVNYTLPALTSLHLLPDSSLKYFSGKMGYENRFTITNDQLKNGKRLLLSLNRVREIAEVFVNGQRVDFHWHDAACFDITPYIRAGENYLFIEVVNTPNNFLVGDGKKPLQQQQSRTSVAKLPNAWMIPLAEAPLLPAGLLGPVILQWADEW